MKRVYTDDQRKQLSSDVNGKTVESMEWVADDGGYWVITFTEGFELCVRLMAEMVEVPG